MMVSALEISLRRPFCFWEEFRMVMRAAHTRCRVTSPGPSMPSGGSGRSLLLDRDRAAEKRDELSSLQPIEMHSLP
jgi:hypothetical protein